MFGLTTPASASLNGLVLQSPYAGDRVLFGNPNYSDATVRSPKDHLGTIPLHRCILGKASPMFDSLLLKSSPVPHPLYKIQGTEIVGLFDNLDSDEHEATTNWLRFCYGFDLAVSPSNAPAVLAVLLRLQITGKDELQRRIESFMLNVAEQSCNTAVDMLLKCLRYTECHTEGFSRIDLRLAQRVFTPKNFIADNDTLMARLMSLPPEYIATAQFGPSGTAFSEYELRSRYYKQHKDTMTEAQKKSFLASCRFTEISVDELGQLMDMCQLNDTEKMELYRMAYASCRSKITPVQVPKLSLNDLKHKTVGETFRPPVFTVDNTQIYLHNVIATKPGVTLAQVRAADYNFKELSQTNGSLVKSTVGVPSSQVSTCAPSTALSPAPSSSSFSISAAGTSLFGQSAAPTSSSSLSSATSSDSSSGSTPSCSTSETATTASPSCSSVFNVGVVPQIPTTESQVEQFALPPTDVQIKTVGVPFKPLVVTLDNTQLYLHNVIATKPGVTLAQVRVADYNIKPATATTTSPSCLNAHPASSSGSSSGSSSAPFNFGTAPSLPPSSLPAAGTSLFGQSAAPTSSSSLSSATSSGTSSGSTPSCSTPATATTASPSCLSPHPANPFHICDSDSAPTNTSNPFTFTLSTAKSSSTAASPEDKSPSGSATKSQNEEHKETTPPSSPDTALSQRKSSGESESDEGKAPHPFSFSFGSSSAPFNFGVVSPSANASVTQSGSAQGNAFSFSSTTTPEKREPEPTEPPSVSDSAPTNTSNPFTFTASTDGSAKPSSTVASPEDESPSSPTAKSQNDEHEETTPLSSPDTTLTQQKSSSEDESGEDKATSPCLFSFGSTRPSATLPFSFSVPSPKDESDSASDQDEEEDKGDADADADAGADDGNDDGDGDGDGDGDEDPAEDKSSSSAKSDEENDNDSSPPPQ